MRILALVILTFLAACSGGSGGGGEFVPSLDLDTTHPWLRARWTGTSTSSKAGPQPFAFVDIRFPPVTSTTDYLDCEVSFTNQAYGTGRVRAGSNQVRGDASGPLGFVEWDGAVSANNTRMQGTFRAWRTAMPEGAPWDTGTFDVTRPATAPASVEVYRAPGWTIIVSEQSVNVR